MTLLYSHDVRMIEAAASNRWPLRRMFRRVRAVFRTIQGKRQAAAFDLVSIRRGEAQDPPVYPGDIIVVDGSSVKSMYKHILQSIPLLAIFGPL